MRVEAPNEPGLKTIISPPPLNLSRPTPICLNRNRLSSPTSSFLSSSSPSSSSSSMAINSDSDQIHCESDIETSEEEEEEEERGCTATGRRRDKRFPPPIPFLARTGHLTCHMPWTLHRTYGDDGRLVIREVIDESGGYYFRARRSNGRLTLHLVHLVRSPPPPPSPDEGRAVDDPGLDAAAAVGDPPAAIGGGGEGFHVGLPMIRPVQS